MDIRFSISLCTDAGEKFFGEGPYRILKGVERLGSLRSAAMEMGMAYTKAFRLVRAAEEACGFPLTCRRIGGEGGGGSVLTPQAQQLLLRYEALREDCRQESLRLYHSRFDDFWPNGQEGWE